MELTHTFTVPTPVETTWAHFEDVAAVAECFPGATVTSVEGETFRGSCKVKLGPIALVYTGSGTFVDKDEAAHSFKVEAKGKDKRGNGTAGAKVTLTMADTDGGTEVEVLTDLAVTGKPAQFGRGVMQDVSNKLLGQFVACLEQRLAGPSEGEPEPPAAEPASTESAGAAPAASGRHAAESPPAPSRPAPTSSQDDDALDLGAAVLPVLLRSYWKQGSVGVGLVALVVWLVRRR
ncbi:MAG: SRPBCC family protein [Nocardioides sp.]